MTRSIQQLPNTVSSTEIVEVATATGFNAGDLVYYQGNDYKSSSNLSVPSTVNFPITGTIPSNSSVGGSSIIQPVFGATQYIRGGSNRRFAAVLTNGNIVQVFNNVNSLTNQYCMYFQIVNTSGTIIVAPTVISTTYKNTSNSNICVVALTGGGFAISFINSTGGTANLVNIAVYTNTGAVTTAISQDTGVTTLGYCEMVALANGGFAIAVMNTSGAISLRAFGSTGTASYAWVAVGLTSRVAGATFGITARSDSSVFIVASTSTTLYGYVLYNSSGTAIVSATTFSATTASNNLNADASVLSDGTTIVIAYYDYNSTNIYPCFRFLPTGNTLSAQTIAIPVVNSYWATTNVLPNFISVLGLSSGGFALAFTDSYNTIQYAFYNSSGAVVSQSNTNGAIPNLLLGGWTDAYSRVSMLEVGGYLTLYWSNTPYNNFGTNQFYAQINETTYLPVVVSGSSGTLTTVSATSGSVISSTVRPSSLAVNAGATTTNSVVSNMSSVYQNILSVTQNARTAICNCTLTSGQYVIAYIDSTGLITINIYSANSTLLNSFTLTGSTASGSQYTLAIAALSNGSFAIAYGSPSNTSTINVNVYSSTFSLVNIVSLTGSTLSQTTIFDIAGLNGGNFVFAYTNASGYASYAVYSNTGATIVSSTAINAAATTYVSVVASNNGGFGITYYASFGYFVSFIPSSSTSYYAASSVLSMSNTNVNSLSSIASTPSGQYIVTSANSSTYWSVYIFTEKSAASKPVSGNSSGQPYPNSNTSLQFILGNTSNGGLVMVACQSASLSTLTYVASGVYSVTIPALANNFPANATSININASFGNQIAFGKISPLTGSSFFFTWIDSNGYPNIGIFNAIPQINSYTLTSGSNVSGQIPINPNPSITNNVNGILAGVAVTNASAGSTGQVVINGLAQLNSSYSATNTGAFDYTGLAVDGVKGTYNGRNVNLQGNS